MKKIPLIITSTANPHVKFFYHDLMTSGLYDLQAIADRDAKRLSEAETWFKPFKKRPAFFRNWRDMLDRHRDAEAVMVGSDNQHHYEETLAAAEMDKHVLSMKVLSMDEKECAAMISRMRQKKKVLGQELELRFHPQYQRVRKQIRSGALGKILGIYLSNISQSPICYYPDWGDPALSYGKKVAIRPGSKISRGGAITDHPHSFDLIRWLTGVEFQNIHAVSGPNMRGYLKVEDHAAMTGTLTDGTPFMINPSYSHLEERSPVRKLIWPKSLEVWLKVVGTKGTAMAEFFQKPIFVLGSGHPSPNRYIMESGETLALPGRLPLLKNFFQAVRGEAPVEVPGEDGLAAVQVMNAAYDSISNGRTVTLRR